MQALHFLNGLRRDQGRYLRLQQDMQGIFLAAWWCQACKQTSSLSYASVHPCMAPAGLSAGLTCMISSSSRSSSSVKLCLSKIASMGELCAKLATLQNMMGLGGAQQDLSKWQRNCSCPTGTQHGPILLLLLKRSLHCASELALRSTLIIRRPSAAFPFGQGSAVHTKRTQEADLSRSCRPVAASVCTSIAGHAFQDTAAQHGWCRGALDNLPTIRHISCFM